MIKQANILAGGQASRMGRQDIPKTLLPVHNGKPVLGFVLDSLLKAGIEDLIVTLPRNPVWAEAIVAFINQGYGLAFSKTSFIEAADSIRESIIKTRPLYQDNFLMLAGDIFTDADLTQLAKQHLDGNIFSLMTTFKQGGISHHGVIVRDGADVTFVPKGSHDLKEGWVDAAIYALSKRFIDLLESDEAYHHAIIKAFLAGKAGIHEHHGYCFDINTDERYQEVCEFIRQLENG